MASDVRMTGAVSVKEVGRRLKQVGDGRLRRELLAGIRDEARKMIPGIQQGAEDRLPRRGGLAAQVAGQKFAVRTSLATGSVRIVGQGMKSMEDIDAGKLRHPVFGDRKLWKQQSVAPGFFSGPIEARLPAVHVAINHVLDDVTKKLEKPL